jgi:hypothetical protein
MLYRKDPITNSMTGTIMKVYLISCSSRAGAAYFAAPAVLNGAWG